MPVLLVYGETVYRAVCGGGPGLLNYAKVGLAEAVGGDDAAFALPFRKLTSRAVVVWPEAVDDGYACACANAALSAAVARVSWDADLVDTFDRCLGSRDITCDGRNGSIQPM